MLIKYTYAFKGLYFLLILKLNTTGIGQSLYSEEKIPETKK